MSCDTREKVRSGPEVVRKTFLIFDFNPVEDGGNGDVGIGVIYIGYINEICIIHVKMRY